MENLACREILARMDVCAALGPFEDCWEICAGVEGWFNKKEAMTLWACAQHRPESGQVVELGSYAGKSTLILGHALSLVSGPPLVTIDTFQGNLHMMDPKYKYFDPETGEVEILHAYRENTRPQPFADRIVTVIADTSYAAEVLGIEHIRLLFVDAEHVYPYPLYDLLNWAGRIVPGGILVCHDAQHPGVIQSLDEYIDEKWVPIGQVENTLLFIRRDAP